ncbi:Hypothetical predicted protein, partial [Paramuricea clavata]
MAPTPPENDVENTSKKTGKRGGEDGCENMANRPTNLYGNAHDVGFRAGSVRSDHHQE